MININGKIKQLNRLGKPAIFVVTGNNSSGKTTITRKLIRDYNFYQSINLGVASKMVRFFRPDINSTELENFEGKKSSDIFMGLIEIIINSYTNSGVNIIIDGVQVNTHRLFNNPKVLGGVILEIKPSLAIKRGNKSKTHFNRVLTINKLKHITYEANKKYILINNEAKISNTYRNVVLHLDYLLTKKLENNGQE